MKISKEQIEFLAKEAGITVAKATKIIEKQIGERFSIYSDYTTWGFTIGELLSMGDPVSMIEIEDAVAELGFKELKSCHVDAFLAARVMGDGDCPHCGGELLNEFEGFPDVRMFGSPEPPEPLRTYCSTCGYEE